jgi:membrane protease YdiL (CAAX protease family)
MISRKDFTTQDYILITLLVAYTLFTYFAQTLSEEYNGNIYVVIGLRVLKLVLCLLLCIVNFYANKTFFKQQWQIFLKRSWIKYLWIFLGWIGIVLLMNLTRSVLKWVFKIPLLKHWSAIEIQAEDNTTQHFILVVVVGLNLLLLPFAKEYIIRHLLFLKHLGNRNKMIIYAVLGALLYAIGYYFVNQTVLSCVPYMISSVVLYFIYWQSNNIYYPIFCHLLFTGILFFVNLADSFILPYIS